MRQPVVIEAAINGIAKKTYKPNAPLSADEIAAESLADDQALLR